MRHTDNGVVAMSRRIFCGLLIALLLLCTACGASNKSSDPMMTTVAATDTTTVPEETTVQEASLFPDAVPLENAFDFQKVTAADDILQAEVDPVRYQPLFVYDDETLILRGTSLMTGNMIGVYLFDLKKGEVNEIMQIKDWAAESFDLARPTAEDVAKGIVRFGVHDEVGYEYSIDQGTLTETDPLSLPEDEFTSGRFRLLEDANSPRWHLTDIKNPDFNVDFAKLPTLLTDSEERSLLLELWDGGDVDFYLYQDSTVYRFPERIGKADVLGFDITPGGTIFVYTGVIEAYGMHPMLNASHLWRVQPKP